MLSILVYQTGFQILVTLLLFQEVQAGVCRRCSHRHHHPLRQPAGRPHQHQVYTKEIKFRRIWGIINSSNFFSEAIKTEEVLTIIKLNKFILCSKTYIHRKNVCIIYMYTKKKCIYYLHVYIEKMYIFFP